MCERIPEAGLTDAEKRQKAYYDRIASDYDPHYGSPAAMRYREQLFDRIFHGEDLRGVRVLDAMCGGGQNTAYFLERGCDVSAIDISESQVALYRGRYPDLEVVCGSILDTDFSAGSFDLVVTDSVHHLHPRVDVGLAEFHRLLRPAGRLVIWEPTAGSILDYLRRAWYRLDRRYFEENERSLDLAEAERRFAGRFAIDFSEFGGNLAYVFVVLSMGLRIPVRLVNLYARPLLALEWLLGRLQTRATALWVLALLRKEGGASHFG